MATAKKTVDWELIEKHYRAGLLTLMQMAEIGGVTEGAIRKRAKRDDWTRDLSAKIKAKTEELVRKEAVRKASTKNSLVSEKEAITIGAEAAATIVILQQGRIGRHLKVSQSLLDELESQTIDKALYEQLGEMMHSPDERGMDKLNDLYRKVITTSSRIDSHKKAVETERALIAMERQAFNIDDAPPESSGTYEKLVAALG